MHDDLVQRNVTAPAPDVVWLTDITEHPTGEGKLCLCSIKDLRRDPLRLVHLGLPLPQRHGKE